MFYQHCEEVTSVFFCESKKVYLVGRVGPLEALQIKVFSTYPTTEEVNECRQNASIAWTLAGKYFASTYEIIKTLKALIDECKTEYLMFIR